MLHITFKKGSRVVYACVYVVSGGGGVAILSAKFQAIRLSTKAKEGGVKETIEYLWE